MHRQLPKRALAILLTLMLLLCCTVTLASAGTITGTIVNCTSYTNVRTGTSSDTALLGRAYKGDTYSITQTYANGSRWHKINFDGQTGYVFDDYISFDGKNASADDTSVTGTIVNCSSYVNVRTGASSDTSVLGQATRGTSYIVLQAYATNTWHKIRYGGSEGYVYVDYLKLDGYTGTIPGDNTGGDDGDSTDSVVGTVTNCNSYVNVRASASASGTLIGTAKKGATYTVLQLWAGDEWHKIQYGDQVGYICSDFLSIPGEADPGNAGQTGGDDDNDSTVTGTVVNCNSYVNVRASASTSSSILGTAKKGATYTVLQANAASGWHKIQYGNQAGYISASYFSIPGVTTGDDDSDDNGGSTGSYTYYDGQDMRTLTGYSASTLEKGLKLGLSGMGSIFANAERTYGVNALFLMSICELESGHGTTTLATQSNNLAGIKRSGSYTSFDSKEECVNYLAGLLSKNYLADGGKYNNGPTISGVCVMYCGGSSSWTSQVTTLMWENYKACS